MSRVSQRSKRRVGKASLVMMGHTHAATDVIVSGCSAGGLAVYLHVDEVADMFKGKPDVKVRGLAGRYCL